MNYASANNIKAWSVDQCTSDDGVTDAYGDILFLDKSEDLSKVTNHDNLKPEITKLNLNFNSHF